MSRLNNAEVPQPQVPASEAAQQLIQGLKDVRTPTPPTLFEKFVFGLMTTAFVVGVPLFIIDMLQYALRDTAWPQEWEFWVSMTALLIGYLSYQWLEYKENKRWKK